MSSTLAGEPITTASLTIPRYGIPHLDCILATDADAPTGSAALSIDGSTFTMHIHHSGEFEGVKKASAVGGFGGWRTALPAKGYASPVGVFAAQVITDAARECGELPGALPTSRIGAHYARQAGPASRVLSLVDGWWVDSTGLTQTGERVGIPITDPDLTVLDYNPSERRLLLGVGIVSQYVPGNTITLDSLGGTVELDLVEVHVQGEELRVQAWIV